MANGTKAPKGALIAGVVLLLLGLGGCGAAAVGVASLASLAEDVTNTTPYGETTSFTSSSDAGALVLLSNQATCAGVDGSGNELVFEDPGGNITVDANGEQFTSALTFDTTDGETYELTCADSSGQQGGTYTVLKLPSILAGGVGVLVLAVGGLGGALFLVLGLIFLIVGLVKRSKWKKQNSSGGPGAPMAPGGYGAPPAPGGYAPPPPSGAPPMPGGYGAPTPPPANPGPPQMPPPQMPQPQAPRPSPSPSRRHHSPKRRSLSRAR